MRKQIGEGKTRPLAAAERNFSPAHEISRQGLSLQKEHVLFQLAASSADVTPASDIGSSAISSTIGDQVCGENGSLICQFRIAFDLLTAHRHPIGSIIQHLMERLARGLR